MPDAANTAPLRGELERVSATPEQQTIVDLIRSHSPVLQRALGRTLTVEQFETAAMTYLRANPRLWECDPMSIVGGLRLGAQLGLALGPLGHFYLVPFAGRATFVLGYRGMVELAYRSGKVRRVQAFVVRDGDYFEFRHGTRAQLDHTPDGPPAEREWTATYAVAETTTGGKPFEVLYPDEVAAFRKRSPSQAHRDSPWNTDTEAMWRKTAVRRLQRWLPQTPDAAHALEVDETIADVENDDVGGDAE